MSLADLEGKKREELSLVEIARAILEDHGKRIILADIVNAVQEYLDVSDEETRERLPQSCTDTSTDGEFISMRDNVWAFHPWFLYESVDGEIDHPENENNEPRKKHHREVNAFIASSDDDNIIDYDSGDPRDDDLNTKDDDNIDDFGATDGDDFDGTDDDDELPDGIEGQLSELDDEDGEDDK